MRYAPFLLGTVLSTGLVSAQNVANYSVADGNRIHAGTYSVATGLTEGGPVTTGVTSSLGTASCVLGTAECGLGLIYNNSVAYPTLPDAFHNASFGNTIIDEGRIPSIDGGGPADTYSVVGLTIGYVTNQPHVDVRLSFWCDGDTCDTLATLGTPAAQFDLLGLPGSPDGMNTTLIVDVDLCDLAFDLIGDANGIRNDGDWDRFGWGFKVLNQDAGMGHMTGPLAAGDPQSCARGLGLFGAMGGFGTFPALGCDGQMEGESTGLATQDSFRRASDGPAASDCFFFGGYPANPLGSFYLKLHSSNVNDECSTAIDLGSSIGAGLASCDTCCATSSTDPVACGSFGGSPDVWYEWVAPLSATYVFDTCGSDYDTVLAVYSGACGALTCEAFNDDACGVQSRVQVSTMAGQSYLIRIGGFDASECGSAVLGIDIDPCSIAMDDVFGDNDTCVDSTLISGATLSDFAFLGDDDFYAGVVCAGETVTIDALFVDADGDIDLELFEGFGGCPGTLVSTGNSTTDNEQVSFTNTSASAVRFYVRVLLFDGDCNSYELQVAGNCTVGTTYCSDGVQNPNSTGKIALLTVWGSLNVVDDDLNLLATCLPPNSPGYFIWSTSQGLIDLPAVSISDGFLCLGSGQGRFNGRDGGPGMVLNSGPDGTFQLFGIDTTMMPQSSMAGNLAIFPGLSGYFQAWYRDSAGTFGNNFTNAVTVTWQ